ncbi:MAG: AAC(3) family N-acetyltransferase [Colwellia sp.]|nr:AAC(3) family N-acetyltransferase [Colwellia sp.]
MHKFYIDPEQLKVELLKIEANIPDNVPVMIHSDILKVGFPCEEFDADAAGKVYETLFLEVFANRSILIPTFCYDYCSTRVFDVHHDLGQVGFLSRHMVKHHAELRSKTPVFNFVILNNQGFSLEPVKEAFGSNSIYEQFFAQKGYIILLGVGILRCTPLMYVESQSDVIYRYEKQFPGKVLSNNKETDVEFSMPVRPLNPDVIEYSDILEIDLLKSGIMKKFTTGFATTLVCPSDEFFNFFESKLKLDAFYPLTDKAKIAAQKFCKTNKRFSIELCG